ncbi:hypothetical protein Emin_0884 [Elusimicrobium minutum Pei191]|uniref:Uncharacterized protein n=1 Tax=Elusimicrobium minutum (strain Pei191) TaxID=445932 RepID=B2KD43_ELUMP|nr:hypothetical protein [Elusimicrobium minutum]ACC98439.1 hypothetical protein Emin_0884 [Elusimicrobium minutum Pei191]
MPAVKDYSKKSKKVFVISIYTTRSAQSLYDNALKAAKEKGINTEEGFGKAEIIYSQNSLIDYPQTPKIVLEFAKKSL